MPAPRRILYVDMDNVMVDFPTGIARLTDSDRTSYEGRFDEAPGIFSLMDPVPGAIEAFTTLSERFDTYLLSTAPWRNSTAWADKLLWVQRHLGAGPDGPAYKRLILSHHKHLAIGDYLVDDREANGAGRFTGELIRFGSPAFPDWAAVVAHLGARAEN